MAEKDIFERLCKYFEFMVGPLPKREAFKRTLQDTVTADELDVFFLLPLSGHLTLDKLKKKARIPVEELYERLHRLASEGLILAYETPEGWAYERGNPVFMTEQQVRKLEDTPRRTFYAEYFNTFLKEEEPTALPTKTPYYRVLPVEATLTTVTEPRTIPMNVVIPDPRQVLPIDIIAEVMKKEETLIGVAECYCRRTKRIVGEACDYPLETCFVFNRLAQTLIEHGFARKIEYTEAMKIIRQCEELGLVHNVDNCTEEIQSLCNCCSCCCVLLKVWARGQTNAGAPSRYVVEHDVDKGILCETCISRCPTNARSVINERLVSNTSMCLGCGLCVTTCPQGANRMVLREKPSKIPRTYGDLYGKIGREAIVGMVKRKIVGR